MAQHPQGSDDLPSRQVRQLVAAGLRDRDAGRVSDGPMAMVRIRQALVSRFPLKASSHPSA